MRKYLQLLSLVVLLLSSSQVMAQKVRVVTGHVYDPGKEALVGVTVAVKGFYVGWSHYRRKRPLYDSCPQ